MVDWIGTRIDRYEIRERLGAGGMARVFKAWDTNLARDVAIKVLYEHLAEDTTFQQRFEQEAKFVASFKHPNIVPVYDFNAMERGGELVYYMVMGYIPGKTLKAVLEELPEGERLSHERVLNIALNVLDALGYAHKRGMVHRDVKPGNILFDEDEQAVLTDFGIARMAQGIRLTRESVTIGTPAYMSPEQAVGAAVDARSDLYSVGVMLYEMLAGRTPFVDDGSLAVLLKHINEPVPLVSPFLSTQNAALDRVILTALAKNPDQRYQTASEFAIELKAAFAGENVHPLRLSGIGTGTMPLNTRTLRATLGTLTARVPRQAYTPLAALVVGLALIGLLVIGNLIGRLLDGLPSVSTASTQPTALATPAGQVDSMTTVQGTAFTSTFDANDSFNQLWSVGQSTGDQRTLTPDGFYRFANLQAGTGITSILTDEYDYSFVSISMDGMLTADSPRTSAYGIVFRYRNNQHYYVFTVDGSGRYAIWRREETSWIELRDEPGRWTSSDVIRPLGEVNRLTVTVRGSRITAFVNDEQLVDLADDTLTGGNIGIYLASAPDQGNAIVLVDSYSATPIVPSMTDPSSSTGGR